MENKTECPQFEHNQAECNCPKVNCERHGQCCACVRHHRTHTKTLPYCLRGHGKKAN